MDKQIILNSVKMYANNKLTEYWQKVQKDSKDMIFTFEAEYTNEGFIFFSANLGKKEGGMYSNAYFLGCFYVWDIKHIYENINVVDFPAYTVEDAKQQTKNYFNHISKKLNNL